MADERFNKEIKRLCCFDTKNVTYNDIAWVMRRLGFEEKPGKGSHMVFKNKGYPPFVVPNHKPLKPIYLKLMCKYLEDHGFWSGESCK